MKQKTAIITGGSRGLGRDMAINLAQNGVDIIISYHTNIVKANEVVHEIESLGRKAKAIPFNAHDPGNAAIFMKRVKKKTI